MELFVPMMSSFLSSLHILEISSLSNVGLVKIPFCRQIFYVVDHILSLTEASQSQEDPFINIDISVNGAGVIFRKWSSVPIHSRLFPTLL